ncbi:hypothetical protein CI109_107262 [Kwoniella shandongensis]|uniref:CAF17 C-terminal domain-containing protein n=1 Tax=Kwoniella shandongensis TaxID=1734106 RepID=A0A5M6C2H9_9TREE|nr:uncharacterized protein CI109_002544 [Kwoniella shandongensis]KAA5529203.1 hypothetical protein CI109_002544 [Kwoniella shandongensis]
MSTSASAFRTLLSTTPRIAPLPQRSVLELSGPDAQKFLKGLSCKDVDSLQGGYSGFLNASGRILHTTFITPITSTTSSTSTSTSGSQQKYLISHESGADHPAPLQSLLPPFRLRAKVKIRDVSSEWDAWSAYGEEGLGEGSRPIRNWRLGSGGAAESQWVWEDGKVRDLGLAEGEVGSWDLRAGWGGMGRQLLIPRGKKPSLTSSHDTFPTDEYNLHRILLGVPEGAQEIVPGSALPLESCMDIHGGVDFRKGCYLGQELTVRTYHTGATRKRILPIRLLPLNSSSSSSTPLSSLITSPISTSSSSTPTSLPLEVTYHPPSSSATRKPRSAGKILSLYGNTVGLALVRLEMVERSWWSGGKCLDSTVGEWTESGVGRLTTQIEGQGWGVFVDKGEAYGAALQYQQEQQQQDQ